MDHAGTHWNCCLALLSHGAFGAANNYAREGEVSGDSGQILTQFDVG